MHRHLLTNLHPLCLCGLTATRKLMEEKIDFLSEDYKIEGLLDKKSEDKGAVITHPHPLYGGDMYNFVVGSIAQAYQKYGYTTLRFNFRGVGGSQGHYDEGIGEQNDLLAALSYLNAIGIKQIDLTGYSFGAWINAQAIRNDVFVKNMVMVSPPVGFVNFHPTTSLSPLKLVVTGSRDDIAPAHLIKKILPAWNPNAVFEIIDGADHFYGGYVEELESVVSSHL